MDNVFEKVLLIGPDINGNGGMASVLKSYVKMEPKFHYEPSNSSKGTLAGLFALLRLVLLLPYYCWVRRVKIVHIHGASQKSFVRKSFIIKLVKLLGRKVIFHCHSAEFEDYVEKRGRHKISKVLLKCDSVVVLSKKWADYFRSTLRLSNVTVINNIVEPVENRRGKNNDENNRIGLLFLGAIGNRKGIFDLLEVISTHKDELENNIKLIIGGNGEVDKLTKLITDEHLENVVQYVGWVVGDDKKRLLNDCDVVILPSYNEGLPIVLLEAMANAKPAISTSVGGIPEIIKNGVNGIIIRPGDKNALYDAIKSFVENRHLITEYGQNAFKMVADFYPETVKSQLKTLYNQLLKSDKNV